MKIEGTQPQDERKPFHETEINVVRKFVSIDQGVKFADLHAQPRDRLAQGPLDYACQNLGGVSPGLFKQLLTVVELK